MPTSPSLRACRRARTLPLRFARPSFETLESRTLLDAALGGLFTDFNNYASDTVLVRFTATADPRAHLPAGAILEPLSLVDGLYAVRLPQGWSVAQGLGALGSLPGARYVQPDFLVYGNAIPNDPSFTSQWDLNNTGQFGGTVDADLDAPEAWDRATGSGRMLVAVIDTGIDYTHPDLATNIWTNSGEVAGNGVDDDGNGFVDDVHGYDFVNNDADPMDDNSHGTHAAGTIGAVGNNGIGVAGIAWNVQLMALKFLNSSGTGSTSNAIRALNYAVQMGAQISNNSWGSGSYSQSLADAIAAAKSHGHIFVAAAGNNTSDNDVTPFYPANYSHDNVVSVAATDRYDRLASYSNFGDGTVDLAAPGTSILSTLPGGGYGYKSGTSMATPHVAGALALVWDVHPDWTYDQVIQQVLSTVDPLATLAGKVATGGRLNVSAALGTATAPPPTPTAPSNLSASNITTSSVILAWTDNASNETGFTIERQTAGTWAQAATVGANVTSWQDSGLTASTDYSYRVLATNSTGNSGYSNVVAITTAAPAPTPPAAPTDLTAGGITTSAVTLSWTDNAGDETGFTIERQTGGTWAQVATVGANVTTWQDSGLTAGTDYSYRVLATNSTGNSGYSNVVAITTAAPAPTPPAAPTDLTAGGITTSAVTLTWTDNAGDETGFIIERQTGGTWAQVATVGANVTAWQDSGLTAGTSYSYRVMANNDGGNSAYSNVVAITTTALPLAAPSNLAAQAKTKPTMRVLLSWIDNAANESGFRVFRTSDGGATWTQIAQLGVNVTSYSDSSVSGGTTYSYRIAAYNGSEQSAFSNVVNVTVSGQGAKGNSAQSQSASTITAAFAAESDSKKRKARA